MSWLDAQALYYLASNHRPAFLPLLFHSQPLPGHPTRPSLSGAVEHLRVCTHALPPAPSPHSPQLIHQKNYYPSFTQQIQTEL